MIKKSKQSQYNNQNWKVYTCTNCGDEYYFKFQDSVLCLTCQKEIHEEIKQRLKSFNENKSKLNKQFKITIHLKIKDNERTINR